MAAYKCDVTTLIRSGGLYEMKEKRQIKEDEMSEIKDERKNTGRKVESLRSITRS